MFFVFIVLFLPRDQRTWTTSAHTDVLSGRALFALKAAIKLLVKLLHGFSHPSATFTGSLD
jgi:hypothetical protein